MRLGVSLAIAGLFAFIAGTPLASAGDALNESGDAGIQDYSAARELLREVPVPPPDETFPSPPERTGSGGGSVVFGRFTSIQVNTNALGENIPNDAANEPSIAIDPTNPNNVVMGWRQFDTIASSFRQAGWAYSHDGGESWTFAGVLEPGQFRSDPVLDSDADGNFYYYSLSTVTSAEMFISNDKGVSWNGPFDGFGGDKEWMVVDKTNSIGRGNIYANWNLSFSCCSGDFTRSVDGGFTFMQPINMPQRPFWGTMTVDPDGDLFLVGIGTLGTVVERSSNAKDSNQVPVFDRVVNVNVGGGLSFATGPNPAGLLGQFWIASDHSDGPSRGNIYVLGSVNPPGFDPLDVMFIRSFNGGLSWTPPIRVNDDALDTFAWQWFGTMSVAPNGRIDVVWNDTRISGFASISQLFYAFSEDQGDTWSENVPITPDFNSHLGWPQQNKLGDYYHMISDDFGANLAYAATFNGEQDVYFLRIGLDCNENDFNDDDDIAEGRSQDCNGNDIPDECDVADGTSPDCDGNVVPDECDPDNDSDGFVDGCDNCPSIPNADQTDTDGDGKGDVCDVCPLDNPDDFDGDGVCNSDDECPDDPDKSVMGDCGCGNPETDDDGDGVPTCVDQCAGVDDAQFAPGCVNAIPAVSDWGLAILTLLLLTFAKVIHGARRTRRAV